MVRGFNIPPSLRSEAGFDRGFFNSIGRMSPVRTAGRAYCCRSQRALRGMNQYRYTYRPARKALKSGGATR
jgi:hypothetical protein